MQQPQLFHYFYWKLRAINDLNLHATAHAHTETQLTDTRVQQHKLIHKL